MTAGLGDSWLAGEPIEGVTFGPGDAVLVRTGRGAGGIGRVRLLLGPPPDPRYLVEITAGGASVRVRQSELEHTT